VFLFTSGSLSVTESLSRKKQSLQLALGLCPHRVYRRSHSLDQFRTTAGIYRGIGRVKADLRDPMAELISDFSALSLDDNDA
jgi:hypothetical protein